MFEIYPTHTFWTNVISWVVFHLSVCQPLLFSNLIQRLSTEIESIERFCDKTIYFVVELQLTELASISTKAQYNEFGLGRLKSKSLQVSKKIIEGLNSCVLQTRSLTLFLRRQEKITEYVVFLENKQIFIMHVIFRVVCNIWIFTFRFCLRGRPLFAESTDNVTLRVCSSA